MSSRQRHTGGTPSRRTGLVNDPIDESLQRAQVAASAREADELVAAGCFLVTF
jgi:hypothetical protein